MTAYRLVLVVYCRNFRNLKGYTTSIARHKAQRWTYGIGLFADFNR